MEDRALEEIYQSIDDSDSEDEDSDDRRKSKKKRGKDKKRKRQSSSDEKSDSAISVSSESTKAAVEHTIPHDASLNVTIDFHVCMHGHTCDSSKSLYGFLRVSKKCIMFVARSLTRTLQI